MPTKITLLIILNLSLIAQSYAENRMEKPSPHDEKQKTIGKSINSNITYAIVHAKEIANSYQLEGKKLQKTDNCNNASVNSNYADGSKNGKTIIISQIYGSPRLTAISGNCYGGKKK